MKIFTHLFLASAICYSLGLVSCKTKSPGGNTNLAGKTFKVSGKVTSTSSYCGGAAPSQEILESLAQPQPYAQVVLGFREGIANEPGKTVYKTVTDENGRFKVELPAGNYCVIREYQMDRSIFEKYKQNDQNVLVDMECLEKTWSGCIRSIEVNGPVDSVNFQFHFPCFLPEGIPCLNYIGPMPP